MADIVIQSEERLQGRATKDSPVEYTGIANFPTTSQSAELAVKLDNIVSFQATPIGTVAADEIISLDETPASGVVDGSSGTVTIKRTGQTATSGLAFSYSYRGHGE